ncbi:hypothetical protein FKW77_010545 [Venturia effusa]|uniref:Uncharacterized protein n=1 Tax=Venturia effusa TaxID=50376 RepID=A0A517L4J7_9PEZI|nr:hypothetical protein FKW77_010545 [Venturia effusa]
MSSKNTKVCAMQGLEQAFQSQNRSSLDDTMHSPRGQALSKTVPKPVTFESTYSLKRHGTQSNGFLPSTPSNLPFANLGHDTGLPPTPPSHTNERNPELTRDPSMHIQSGARSLDHRASTARTTPPNARSPPTPDTTPPVTSLPARDIFLRLSSSAAESFSTAREEQWSSDEERQSKNDKFRMPRDYGASLEPTGHHDQNGHTRRGDSNAPIEHVPASTKPLDVLATSKRTASSSFVPIPDREWDKNLMRNITVRRKRTSRLQRAEKYDDDNSVHRKREMMPKLVMGGSEEEEFGPETPSLTVFGQTIGWPKATSQTRSRDSESRRLSDMSSNSTTVVEAIVTVSPPRRHRTLRHVSRNMSLRSDAGSSVGNTMSSQSTRTSLSEEISPNRLTHKRASILNASSKGSGNSEMLTSGRHLPKITQKYSFQDSDYSSRADANGNVDRARTLDPLSALGSYHQRRASTGHVTTASDLSGLSNHRLSSLQTKPSKVQSPMRVQFEDSFQYSMRRINSDKKRQSHPTRIATQRALRQADGLAALPEPKVIRPSIDEHIRVKPRHLTSLEILHAFPSPGKSSLKQTMISASERSRSRLSADASTSGSVRRVSFDRSTIGTYELARTNIEHPHLHPDDSRGGRSLLTPFSETSDQQLEISEATAVNLYPHNNNSLLVVQQMARSAETQNDRSDVQETAVRPALAVQPATPPTMSTEIINVDSPLRHPRKPPHPPVQAPIIHISPATPAEELETSPFDEVEGRPGLPKRSLSFKEHAIQFSETLMQPIFPKSHSLKRHIGCQGKGKGDLTQKSNTLHPFWQPRGFWDEFSDSENESDEGDDRLPPGGDTSDVVLPRSMAARVLDSVRSSGGFLIGNSLGVERAGSNMRRHHVSLPIGLGKRTSSHVLRSTSAGTLRSLKSLESLSRKSHTMKKWNPKNWRVRYVGIGGMREVWKEKQAMKRRQKLRDSIGIRYMVEGAPVI